jgi:TonB family protein
MAHSPMPHAGLFQRTRLSAMQAAAERAEPLRWIPPGLLSSFAQQAIQMTRATGAAIALEQNGELICRAAVGGAVPEVGSVINSESGLTGVCFSSGTTQLCSNTELDSRVDAEACRQMGIRAIIVVPFFRKDQTIGLLEVFSRRPYAFGKRDLQELDELAERIAESLQSGQESPLAVAPADQESSISEDRRPSPLLRWLGLGALVVIALLGCALAVSRWKLRQHAVPNAAKGRLTAISTLATVPAGVFPSTMAQGTLIHRVEPEYPSTALQRHLEGSVVVQAHIGKDGSVLETKPIRGEDLLARAAAEAVLHWRFSPWKVKGKPVDVLTWITIEFSGSD